MTLLRGTRSDPNNNSIVVSVRIGSVTALFPGDVEREAQDELITEQSLPQVDVLKVPHHGSPYSEPAFFDKVRPRIALVSVGAHNRYGHPSPTVLRYLRRQGALVRRTDLDGDIAVISSGSTVTVAHRGER
jgi:competence protein ComEC